MYEPIEGKVRKPRACLANLPEEILLAILSYLEPSDIARLQQVARKLCDLFRDDMIWRSICFHESGFIEKHGRLQGAARNSDLARGLSQKISTPAHDDAIVEPERRRLRPQKDFSRLMANWDLSYIGENVSWYNEYIQRHGRITISWLQQPTITKGHSLRVNEVRGLALYRPDNPSADPGRTETVLAVSPLEDGSVCIWDVNGAQKKAGAIYNTSKPGILFIDSTKDDKILRSKRVDSGVTECVAVDSHRQKAYIAVQSRVLGIDIETMSVTSCELFPWSVTTMSTATPDQPLTIGTTHGLHLYDHRSKRPASQIVQGTDGIDSFDRLSSASCLERTIWAIFNDDPLPPYASLAQPGPLSILHLGLSTGALDDIYVAGRFPNILHYDRRKFGPIVDSIHSGARLCCMTSLPYAYARQFSERRRKGQMSLSDVHESMTKKGHTIVACGEYNTKGSLELYGLENHEVSTAQPPMLIPDSMKNRQTSSRSKILSVANHGTRLVISDGSGSIKWFERDGFTEVRKCRIGSSNTLETITPSIFSSMPGSGDMARKLLPVAQDYGSNDNNIVFWTGESLGLVGFSAKSGFTAEEFEDESKTAAELEMERAERMHRESMRVALQRQAEDVVFVRGLGLRVPN